MRRTAARSWAWIVLGAGTAAAQDGPPPLAPPADPPAAAPAPRVAERPFYSPFLPNGTIGAPLPTPIEPEADLPPLSAPAEMGPIRPAPAARPGLSGRPLGALESTPLDRLDPMRGPRPRSVPAPADPASPPPDRRRLRLFGRFQPAPPPLRRDRDVVARAPSDPIRIEHRADPDADEALRRKVEAQVREALGNRVRMLEVTVVDRNITIRARPDRFWHRRNVRRALESLPAVSGYKTTIDVEE